MQSTVFNLSDFSYSRSAICISRGGERDDPNYKDVLFDLGPSA